MKPWFFAYFFIKEKVRWVKKQIAKAKSAMLRAAKEMNFNEAARLRDEMYSLEKLLGEIE